MAQFKKGDVVRVKAIVPSGPVEKLVMDDDGEVSYQITWVDEVGVEQHRFFPEGQLEAV